MIYEELPSSYLNMKFSEIVLCSLYTYLREA